MVKQGKDLLKNAVPINVFIDDEQVGRNNKSITFNLEFQSMETDQL